MALTRLQIRNWPATAPAAPQFRRGLHDPAFLTQPGKSVYTQDLWSPPALAADSVVQARSIVMCSDEGFCVAWDPQQSGGRHGPWLWAGATFAGVTHWIKCPLRTTRALTDPALCSHLVFFQHPLGMGRSRQDTHVTHIWEATDDPDHGRIFPVTFTLPPLQRVSEDVGSALLARGAYFRPRRFLELSGMMGALGGVCFAAGVLTYIFGADDRLAVTIREALSDRHMLRGIGAGLMICAMILQVPQWRAMAKELRQARPIQEVRADIIDLLRKLGGFATWDEIVALITLQYRRQSDPDDPDVCAAHDVAQVIAAGDMLSWGHNALHTLAPDPTCSVRHLGKAIGAAVHAGEIEPFVVQRYDPAGHVTDIPALQFVDPPLRRRHRRRVPSKHAALPLWDRPLGPLPIPS